MPSSHSDYADLQVLKALNHPNIVRCVECFTHQSKLCIVMDWCSEGEAFIKEERESWPQMNGILML